MILVTVEYAASQPVADAASLEHEIQTEVEQHLKSLTKPVIRDANLKVCVESMEIKPNFGRVRMSLSGAVNDKSVCETVVATDQPSPIDFQTSASNRFVMRAFQNIFAFFYRLLRPSPLSSAVGSIRTNGRILRALQEGLADIRIAINTALEIPESSGRHEWMLAKKRSILGGLIAATTAGAVFILRRAVVADTFRAILGCGLIGTGIAGILFGFALARLPNRFYLSEPAGRRVVKLVGVKSPGAIRTVAVGIVVLCSAFTAAGIYWLVFD